MIDYPTLRHWLDAADIHTVAQQYGITYRQAINIAKGKSKNFQFMRLLVERAEQNMQLAQRTQQLRKHLNLIA